MNRPLSVNKNGTLGALQEFYYVPTSDTIFNGPAYLQKYPAVGQDPVFGINPMMHYLQYGYDQGYDPTGGVTLVPQQTGGGGGSQPPVGGGGDTTILPPTTITSGGIVDWIKQNPLIAGGIAIGVLFAIKKFTKKRK